MEPETVNPPEIDDASNILCGADPGSAAGQLLNLFLTARFARRNQDSIWMTAFRNIRARYGVDVTLVDGWSKSFVNLTSPKIQTAAAIVNDVVLPQGKDIWDLDTTPEPYMPEFTEYLAKQNFEQGINADYEVFKNQIFLESQRRCANLKSRVRDGFAECDFRTKMSDASFDLVLYGSACFFGPFAKERRAKKRGKNSAKKYNYPDMEYVSIFDVYPDPGARSVEDCLYICRRRIVNKAWISNMRSAPGFKKSVLDYVIEHAPDGNWTPEPWETDMIITNNNNQMYTYRHRFVVYDFWMQKTGREMMELGCEENEIDQDDLNSMYMANIMVCNGQVIRATVSDFHRDRIPVYIAQCRKNTHNVWGTGLAELMFDSQAAASACERALNDNMASIARFQTVIDVSRCKMGTNAMSPHPGKVWLVNNSTGGSSKIVEFLFPPNILREAQGRQDSAIKRADEQTGVPSFLGGDNSAQGTHTRTLGGAELQWNNANNPFKTIVTNIENQFVIPITEKFVDYYLTFEYSDEIDCDYKVVSNGLQGLVAKQARVSAMMELLKAVGSNEYWQNRINDKRVGEILEDAFGLTGEAIFLNDSDAKAKMEQMQQMKAQQPAAQKPDTPPIEAKLRILSETDKGTPMYPIALEDALEAVGQVEGKPATAAALNIMREESMTAHRQFMSQADAQALGMDVNPDGSGHDLPDQMQGKGMNAPSGPGWQPGQPGTIEPPSGSPTPQAAPQAGPGGVVQAPLPLGVRSVGTPKAESLIEHPERYSASIPPGMATNPADVGGAGIPPPFGGAGGK